MYRWTPEMIRYMRCASAYSDYYARLANLITPRLGADSHICDVGCGLGDLAAALAPHVRQVTAVDIDRDALQVLEEKGLPNVIPLCGDIAKLPPETPYDAMVFCFFGGIEEVLELASAQCRGDVFLISRNDDIHRFSVGRHPTGIHHGFRYAKNTLEQRGIPFQARELELELGQPFCSWEDARQFFALYSREQDKTLVTDEFLAGKLVKGKGDVPWYLPSLRKLGFIHLRVEDIL